MATLLELKEKLKKIYSRNNQYIIPATKFLITFIALLILNGSIGYMSKIKNPLFALLIAVVCAFLPSGFMVIATSLIMVSHLYTISAEFALMTFFLVLIMYLLYFRIAPKSGYLIIITGILCFIKLPYLVPIAFGLTIGLAGVIPAGFGVIIYYIVKTASEYEAAITGEAAGNSVQKFAYIAESFINNKDMILVTVIVLITVVVVSIIRKMAIENAWNIAIVAGAIIEFIVLVIGKLVLSANLNIIIGIIGILLSVAIGYICEILFFNLDYKRTEVVQYEDDEYYYFVKAVPKISIVNEDVKVKRINAHKAKRADDIVGQNSVQRSASTASAARAQASAQRSASTASAARPQAGAQRSASTASAARPQAGAQRTTQDSVNSRTTGEVSRNNSKNSSKSSSGNRKSSGGSSKKKNGRR